MRTLLSRLGNPDAINWVSVVAVLIYQTSASLITSGVDFDDRFALYLAVRLGSLLLFVGILGLGKWTLGVVRFAHVRPVITITTFLVGITASTALFDLLLVVTKLADQSFLVRRVVLSLVGVTVLLIMIALVVTTAREYARANADLEGAIKDLDSLRVGTEARIQQQQDDLVTTIRDLINEGLNTARMSGVQTAGVMRDLIDVVIRPLSHSLAKQHTPQSTEPPAPVSAIPWRQVVRGALTGQPFSLLAFPGAIGAIVATFLVLTYGLVGTATTIAVFGIAVVVNAVLGFLWRLIPSGTPLTLRALIVTASITPFWWLSVVFIRYVTGFDLAESPVRLTAWTLIVLAAWWVAVLAVSVFKQLKDVNRELEASRREVKTQLAALNGTDHQLRKSISRALHGPVQEAIASSLRKLQDSPEVVNDPGFFASVRDRIDAALQALNTSEATPVDVTQELDDLKEVWEGSVLIDATITQATSDMLARNPGTAQVVLEIVREACNNAIKHGDATEIHILIDHATTQSMVTLRVTNNGSPVATDPQLGLGSQLFSDLSVDWALENHKHGVVLHLALPL